MGSLSKAAALAGVLALGVGIGAGGALVLTGRDGGDSAGPAHDPGAVFRAPGASMSGGAPAVQGGPAGAQAGALADVDTMIAGLKDRLEREPGDGRGWMMLGWSYANTGRPGEAVPAYARAAELLPDDPEVLGQYGAAKVALAEGRYDAETRDLFDRVIALNPNDARGLYHAGLARMQDGAEAEGMDLLKRALAAAPADAPWLADLRARVAAGP